MTTMKEILENDAMSAYICRLIGEEGITLIAEFPEGKEYSDEELADMTQINLNTVRHTLYTLYERRLAEYRRIKNNETGWLTYLWRLLPHNINTAIENELDLVLEKLKKRERYEFSNDFYMCKECGVTLTFNQALDDEFKCPNCDAQMTHHDNSLLLAALSKRVEEMSEILG
jgi:transcription initiation factor TFIIE subunit alpha